MKLFNKSAAQLLGLTLSAFLLVSSVAQADIAIPKKPISEYMKECPWIGLIANHISVGPIKISDVSIHDGDKLVYAEPGELLNGMLKYKVKSDDLEALHLYHLVVGIKGQGAQDCLSHNLGVWDSKGHGKFQLKAPEAPGIYEVRFMLTEGLTCESARDSWAGSNSPSASATIGVIIVE